MDEVLNFPDETRYLLEQIGRVFKVDQICRELKLSDEERLARHQRESAPVMMQLEAWMKAQFEEKRVEPNSGLGAAITTCSSAGTASPSSSACPACPLTIMSVSGP